MFCHQLRTKEFGIDIGQGINVGPGNFEKKNKHKALNKRRTWRIWMSYYVEKKIKLSNIHSSKSNKRRAFNKAIGPGKNQRLGPTFIPDYRVCTPKYNLKLSLRLAHVQKNSFMGRL